MDNDYLQYKIETSLISQIDFLLNFSSTLFAQVNK